MIELAPNLTLISIRENNAELVLPLMTRCYPPVYAHMWQDESSWYLNNTYHREQVLCDAQRPDAPYYLVKWKEDYAGILWYKMHDQSPDFPETPAFKLQRIYLHPDTHGNGIGRAIMDYVSDKARTLGKDLIWLEAMDTQLTAHMFYKKMGYRPTGFYQLDFTRMYPNYRGMVRMSKML